MSDLIPANRSPLNPLNLDSVDPDFASLMTDPDDESEMNWHRLYGSSTVPGRKDYETNLDIPYPGAVQGGIWDQPTSYDSISHAFDPTMDLLNFDGLLG